MRWHFYYSIFKSTIRNAFMKEVGLGSMIVFRFIRPHRIPKIPCISQIHITVFICLWTNLSSKITDSIINRLKQNLEHTLRMISR